MFHAAERFDKLRIDASAVRVPGRAPQWALPSVKIALVVSDALVAVAFLAAFYLREGEHVITEFSAGRINWSREFAPYAAVLLFVVPVRVLAHAYYDLYKLRGEFSYVDDTLRVFKATAVASLLIVAVAFLYRGGTAYRAFSYSRAVFVLDFAFALARFGVLRMTMRAAQAAVRRRGVNLIPTLVVGRGAEASLCIREMRERPELGYRVIGVVENGAIQASVPETFEGVPVVASVRDLAETIRETAANEVIVADAGVSGDLLFDVMMRVGRLRGVEFRIAPSCQLPAAQDRDRSDRRTADDPTLPRTALQHRAHRQTHDGYSRRLVCARAALAAVARDRRRHQIGFEGQRLLQAGARRDGRAHLPLSQIPHDAIGRGRRRAPRLSTQLHRRSRRDESGRRRATRL